MATVEIRIPQLGEGLQEARLIRFLKQPGDSVARDEPIYEMETDKAVMEIESPTAGILEVRRNGDTKVLWRGRIQGRAPQSAPADPGIPASAGDPRCHPGHDGSLAGLVADRSGPRSAQGE